MKKIGLIAGCSHSSGAEIDGVLDSTYNRDHSFGSILCRKLGYEPLNIALNGAANSGIARSISQWFKTEYKPEEMQVFVVIGWTESSRIEIPAEVRPSNFFSGNPTVPWYDSSANSFLRINFGYSGDQQWEKELIPKYHRFMAENPIILENWCATNVLMTQYFLKHLNIPYVMCSTMHMFKPKEHFSSFLVDMIDATRYYNLKTDQDGSFYFKYKNMGYDNPKAKYWHHAEVAHELYAEELYNFVRIHQNNI